MHRNCKKRRGKLHEHRAFMNVYRAGKPSLEKERLKKKVKQFWQTVLQNLKKTKLRRYDCSKNLKNWQDNRKKESW